MALVDPDLQRQERPGGVVVDEKDATATAAPLRVADLVRTELKVERVASPEPAVEREPALAVRPGPRREVSILDVGVGIGGQVAPAVLVLHVVNGRLPPQSRFDGRQDLGRHVE